MGSNVNVRLIPRQAGVAEAYQRTRRAKALTRADLPAFVSEQVLRDAATLEGADAFAPLPGPLDQSPPKRTSVKPKPEPRTHSPLEQHLGARLLANLNLSPLPQAAWPSVLNSFLSAAWERPSGGGTKSKDLSEALAQEVKNLSANQLAAAAGELLKASWGGRVPGPTALPLARREVITDILVQKLLEHAVELLVKASGHTGVPAAGAPGASQKQRDAAKWAAALTTIVLASGGDPRLLDAAVAWVTNDNGVKQGIPAVEARLLSLHLLVQALVQGDNSPLKGTSPQDRSALLHALRDKLRALDGALPPSAPSPALIGPAALTQILGARRREALRRRLEESSAIGGVEASAAYADAQRRLRNAAKIVDAARPGALPHETALELTRQFLSGNVSKPPNALALTGLVQVFSDAIDRDADAVRNRRRVDVVLELLSWAADAQYASAFIRSGKDRVPWRALEYPAILGVQSVLSERLMTRGWQTPSLNLKVHRSPPKALTLLKALRTGAHLDTPSGKAEEVHGWQSACLAVAVDLLGVTRTQELTAEEVRASVLLLVSYLRRLLDVQPLSRPARESLPDPLASADVVEPVAVSHIDDPVLSPPSRPDGQEIKPGKFQHGLLWPSAAGEPLSDTHPNAVKTALETAQHLAGDRLKDFSTFERLEGAPPSDFPVAEARRWARALLNRAWTQESVGGPRDVNLRLGLGLLARAAEAEALSSLTPGNAPAELQDANALLKALSEEAKERGVYIDFWKPQDLLAALQGRPDKEAAVIRWCLEKASGELLPNVSVSPSTQGDAILAVISALAHVFEVRRINDLAPYSQEGATDRTLETDRGGAPEVTFIERVTGSAPGGESKKAHSTGGDEGVKTPRENSVEEPTRGSTPHSGEARGNTSRKRRALVIAAARQTLGLPVHRPPGSSADQEESAVQLARAIITAVRLGTPLVNAEKLSASLGEPDLLRFHVNTAMSLLTEAVKGRTSSPRDVLANPEETRAFESALYSRLEAQGITGLNFDDSESFEYAISLLEWTTTERQSLIRQTTDWLAGDGLPSLETSPEVERASLLKLVPLLRVALDNELLTVTQTSRSGELEKNSPTASIRASSPQPNLAHDPRLEPFIESLKEEEVHLLSLVLQRSSDHFADARDASAFQRNIFGDLRLGRPRQAMMRARREKVITFFDILDGLRRSTATTTEDAYRQLLNKRDLDFLRLVSTGKNSEQISTAMGVSTSVIDAISSGVIGKLGVKDRHSAAMFAAVIQAIQSDAGPAEEDVDSLHRRLIGDDLEIFKSLATGLSASAIAHSLGVSNDTLKQRITSAVLRFGAVDRNQLILILILSDLIRLSTNHLTSVAPAIDYVDRRILIGTAARWEDERIGQTLGISKHTVRKYAQRLQGEFGASDRFDMVLRAMGSGAISPDEVRVESQTLRNDTSASVYQSITTERRRRVVAAYAMGKSVNQIAKELSLSESAIALEISMFIEQMGAADRTEAVILGRSRGVVPWEDVAAHWRKSMEATPLELYRRLLGDDDVALLALMATGRSDQDMASMFGWSEVWLKKKVNDIVTRLGCPTRAAAILKAALYVPRLAEFLNQHFEGQLQADPRETYLAVLGDPGVEMLHLLAAGYSSEKIAEHFGQSSSNAQKAVSNLFEMLGSSLRKEDIVNGIRAARQAGIVDEERVEFLSQDLVDRDTDHAYQRLVPTSDLQRFINAARSDNIVSAVFSSTSPTLFSPSDAVFIRRLLREFGPSGLMAALATGELAVEEMALLFEVDVSYQQPSDAVVREAGSFVKALLRAAAGRSRAGPTDLLRALPSGLNPQAERYLSAALRAGDMSAAITGVVACGWATRDALCDTLNFNPQSLEDGLSRHLNERQLEQLRRLAARRLSHSQEVGAFGEDFLRKLGARNFTHGLVLCIQRGLVSASETAQRLEVGGREDRPALTALQRAIFRKLAAGFEYSTIAEQLSLSSPHQVFYEVSRVAMEVGTGSVVKTVIRLIADGRLTLEDSVDQGEETVVDVYGRLLLPREVEVLRWIDAGYSDLEIGAMIGVTEYKAVELVGSIFNKLNVHRRLEAVAVARHLGLVTVSAPAAVGNAGLLETYQEGAGKDGVRGIIYDAQGVHRDDTADVLGGSKERLSGRIHNVLSLLGATPTSGLAKLAWAGVAPGGDLVTVLRPEMNDLQPRMSRPEVDEPALLPSESTREMNLLADWQRAELSKRLQTFAATLGVGLDRTLSMSNAVIEHLVRQHGIADVSSSLERFDPSRAHPRALIEASRALRTMDVETVSFEPEIQLSPALSKAAVQSLSLYLLMCAVESQFARQLHPAELGVLELDALDERMASTDPALRRAIRQMAPSIGATILEALMDEGDGLDLELRRRATSIIAEAVESASSFKQRYGLLDSLLFSRKLHLHLLDVALRFIKEAGPAHERRDQSRGAGDRDPSLST